MPRLPLLIILFIVSAIIALWESPPAILQTPLSAKHDSFPVAFMMGTETKKYALDGQLEYLFKAERVNYFEFDQSEQNYAKALNPVITILGDGSAPWHIRSEHGHSNDNGDKITFTGNVVVWQINAQHARTELTTEKLVVIPSREYAQTEKAVRLITVDSTTTAVGMKAFFKQDRLLLLSQVQSTIQRATGQHATRNKHDKN
jgi:lipopolysaccharide export system protein LptC